MRDKSFSYGLESNPSSPWVELSQASRSKYSKPLQLFKVLQSYEKVVFKTGVLQIAISESQGMIASVSSNGRKGKVNVWTLGSGEPIASYFHNDVQSVAIGANGTVISGGYDKRVKLWNTVSNQLIESLDTPNGVGYVAANLTANYLAAEINDGVIVWNLKSLQQVTLIAETLSGSDLLKFNETGKLLHVRFGLGENRVWEIPSGQLIRAFPDSHYGEMTYSSIDKRGRILATASDSEYEVYLWDTLSGKRIQVIEAASSSDDGGPFDPHVLLSSDGSVLVTATLDGNIRIWETKNRKLLQEFPGDHETEISSLAMSDRYLVAGDAHGILKIWELAA